jgi:hypothetical protein
MPLVTYSALRLGLLAACFGLGYWAGLRTWLLLVVATFAAWGLSYVLLGGPRDAAALYLAQRAQQRAAGDRHFPGSAADDAAHEDAVVDAAHPEPTGTARAADHRSTTTPPQAGPGGTTSAAPLQAEDDRPR